jgi:hypothetical protein
LQNGRKTGKQNFLMNHVWHAGFAAVLATALLAGFTHLPAHAGEPIIIPSEKGKSAARIPDRKEVPKDVFRFGEKITPPTFDVMTIPVLPSTPLDPKEQKRRKLERLERENWMVVDEGELQEEENDIFNVRDYSLEGLDKEDRTGNVMFRRLSKDKENGQRMPGEPRSAPNKSKAQALLQRRAAEEEEADAESRDNSKQGAHIVGELNLKKMFEPREGVDSLAPKFNKSDLTLQSLLNGNSKPEALRERQESREGFQKMLNRGSTPTLSGRSDPIHQPVDFTRQPFNPTMPQTLGSGTFGGGAFGATPTGVRPGTPLGGSLPNAFAGSAPRAGFSAGPLITPPPEPRGPAKPTMKFDPPRRKF